MIENEKDLLFIIENKYKKRYGFFTPIKITSEIDSWINADKN